MTNMAELTGTPLGLAILVMFERALGEASRWADYLRCLPVRVEAMPLFWPGERVTRLLAGTDLLLAVQEDHASTKWMYYGYILMGMWM
jgi:hypothetical protein